MYNQAEVFVIPRDIERFVTLERTLCTRALSTTAKDFTYNEEMLALLLILTNLTAKKVGVQG